MSATTPASEAAHDERPVGPGAGLGSQATTTDVPSRPRRDWIGLLVLAAAVLAFPVVADPSIVNVGIFIGIYSLAVLGLQLMMGLAGQANLGQAGFFAVGAYSSAVLVVDYGWDPLLAAVVACVITTVFGFVVGLPLLRLKGYYLALATFGFGIIVAVFAADSSFLGRATGIFGIPKFSVAGVDVRSPSSYFYLVWGVALLSLLLGRNLVASRPGRALAALHDSEVAAQTLGVDTFRLRLQVLMVCAGFASISGSLYAHWVSVINPAASSVLLSIRFMVMSVVGGLMSVWGAVMGTAFIEVLHEAIRKIIPRFYDGSTGEIELIVFGVVLTLVLLYMPGGFAELGTRTVHGLRRRLGRRRTLTSERRETSAHRPSHRQDDEPLAARAGRAQPGTVLLQVRGLHKRFGGVIAVHDVDLDVHAGEIVALIGPNGAGKTTLFNVVSGVDEPTSGAIEIHGEDVTDAPPHRIAQRRTARTFQNLQIFGSMTVFDNVKVGRHMRSRTGIIGGATWLTARREERRVDRATWDLLEVVGLQDVALQMATDLPFGRQRQVELARALATEPDLLLLDEPMAGLSALEREEVASVLRRLRAGGMGILLVEHDMNAVMALADRIVVLDNGRKIAVGPPDQVRANQKVIDAYLGADLDLSELEGLTR